VSDLSKCRGCGKPIRFAPTRKGKYIPLDPDPNPEGTIVLEPEYPGQKPLARGLHRNELSRYDGPRYVAHHAVCPSSKHFQTDRVARAAQRTAEKFETTLEAGHKCRVSECTTVITRHRFVCYPHERLIPDDIKLALSRGYRPYQVEGAAPGEIPPTQMWLDAAAAAIVAIEKALAERTPA
jgi:hypothetical protein